MLLRTDPFRDLDRLTESMFSSMTRPAALPMDAYRDEHQFVVEMEVPGVDPDSIDLTVEKNVLTVHAERRPRHADGDGDGTVERIVGERTYGAFSRRMFLGDSLDVDALTADYDAGVLTIRIPVAEQAKPRKIAIGGSSGRREISS